MDERHPQRPLNPYGRSKLMVEQVLADDAQAYGLRSVISLRNLQSAVSAFEWPHKTTGLEAVVLFADDRNLQLFK